MADTPRLRPWLRPVFRPPSTVQFGPAAGGPLVDGLTPTECALLDALDGTVSRAGSFARAADAGIGATRWHVLLELVERLGVLAHVDDPPSRRAVVLVDGEGATARACADVLRASGVARVDVGRTAADVALARGLDPAGRPTPGATRPSAVVLLGEGALDPRRGDPWLSRAVPTLPLVLAGTRVLVGPAVEPGHDGPCLWCLDLHRTDRDIQWPDVMTQVCRDRASGIAAPVDGLGTAPALAHTAAALAALVVLALLDGPAPPKGVSVESSLPWPRLDHRRWTRHPRCDRHPGGPVPPGSVVRRQTDYPRRATPVA